MRDKYIRVTVTVEWGTWHDTLGKRQSTQAQGSVVEMPATILDVCDFVSSAATEIGDELALAIGNREREAKDVMQPKNYGQKT